MSQLARFFHPPFPRHLYPSFARLAGLNILANLMVPLASLIDVAFLGHLSDLRHLGGVAIATVLFNMLYWSFGFLRMGTTGTTAQALGRGQWDEVVTVGLRNGSLAIALGGVLWLAQVPLRILGFAILNAPPEITQAGQAYYDAMIWGAPANLLGFVVLGWFLGQGKGGRVLLLSMVANGSNVLLNYWFIVQWQGGSAGAGWATMLSQVAMTVTGLVLVAWDLRHTALSPLWNTLWNGPALRATLALNGDIMVRTLALLLAFSSFTTISSSLGTVVLATNTLLLQIVSFSSYFIDGIAFATENFAGRFQGQGQRSLLKPLLRLATTLSLVLGLSIALGAIAGQTLVFGWLTSHAAVLAQVPSLSGWLLPILGLGAIAYTLDGYFLGLTQGRVLRNTAVLATGLGFAPVALVASYWQNLHLLWLALALYMLTRVITLGQHIQATWHDGDPPPNLHTNSRITR
jgi:MATE family multidrug resistance protein